MCAHLLKIMFRDAAFSQLNQHLHFSVHDADFVKDVFMKKDRETLYFEDDFNFKLILHERDFVPGVTILANIVDAIKHSRRMIMILSRSILNIVLDMNFFLSKLVLRALPHKYVVVRSQALIPCNRT